MIITNALSVISQNFLLIMSCLSMMHYMPA